jgi:hypothetical protein
MNVYAAVSDGREPAMEAFVSRDIRRYVGALGSLR